MASPRQVAYKCRIIDILSGHYVVKEGWEPNYVETSIGNISRANIIGVVVSMEDVKSFLFDDSTGRILVRSFDEAVEYKLNLGEVVLVIGRPRKYSNDMMLVAEIVKKIEDHGWIEVRKRELQDLPAQNQTASEEPVLAVQQPQTHDVEEPGEADRAESSDDLILEAIKALDSGDGVAIDDLLEKVNVVNAERRIKRLLEEGQIFTLRPGRVKLL